MRRIVSYCLPGCGTTSKEIRIKEKDQPIDFVSAFKTCYIIPVKSCCVVVSVFTFKELPEIHVLSNNWKSKHNSHMISLWVK